MPKPPFIPTHVIAQQGDIMYVQLIDGVLYEYHDWRLNQFPEWELDENGQLLFQGSLSGARLLPLTEVSLREETPDQRIFDRI